MKKVYLTLVVIGTISLLSSCGSSPYKKRKGCRGNGGWYGKRNLGIINHQLQSSPKTKTYYVQHADNFPPESI